MESARADPQVEVRRSVRRRRTVSAYRDGDRVVVMIPATMSKNDERRYVADMLARLRRSEQRRRPTDEQLLERAKALNDEYFGGLADPSSVRWVENQKSRWGSCTPSDRSIRLSSRLQEMPMWVRDYVIVHELAHLLEPGHDDNFWAWVDRYPRTERAKGFLAGWAAASRAEHSDADEDDSTHVD